MADNTTTTTTTAAAGVLARLREQLTTDRWYDIGFPGARDLTFEPLAELLCGHLLNNVGDPWDAGHGRCHTKALEREAVDIVADWLRAPPTRWGYVTSGSSEGNYHALDEAWRAFEGKVVVYLSTAAHYSLIKGIRLLKLTRVMIPADEAGKMNLDELEVELRRHRDSPAMIVATAGTTMTEACDDVAAIAKVCDRLGVIQRRIHVDAALAGLPLALLPQSDRPAFDFTAGATSMVISGHKFLSTLTPCGVLVYADNPHTIAGRRISYTGSADTTIGGSRSGHTPLLLWYALTTLGENGHRKRAEHARELAAYTHRQLRKIGWEAWRNEHAFTVVLRCPPQTVAAKWILADNGQQAHIVCAPGITREQIDQFIEDLAEATGRRYRPKAINHRQTQRAVA